MRWIETPFNSFLGIMKDTRKAPMGSFEELENLDLRGKSGDLEIRPGYVLKYEDIESSVLTAHKITNLEYVSSKNFWVNSNGGREITVQITKQRVTAQTTLSPNYLDMVGIWIRPYWDGSAWVDEWEWLNQVVITKIVTTNIAFEGVNYPAILDIYYRALSEDEFKEFSILHYATASTDYNVPDEISEVIYSSYDDVTRIKIYDNGNTWAANDRIILMKNYIPIKTLTDGFTNATKETISYHNVLDELRVCLGNNANQLAFGIGYKSKYWRANLDNSLPYLMTAVSLAKPEVKATEEQTINTTDRIYLDPYNITTDFLDSDRLYDKAYLYSVEEVSGGSFLNRTYFFVITGVLDGSQEFIIAPMYDGTVPRTYINLSASTNIKFTVNLLKGVFNKRLTNIKIYISEGDAASTSKITNPFYLMGDYPISELEYSGSRDNTLSEDGCLVVEKTYEYADFEKATQTLTDVLGYGAAVDYLRSWRDSLVFDNKAYFLNGYIDQEYKDKIFYSELNGYGSNMPDVVANSYFDYEYFNGDEVIGITKHPNNRIGLGRENTYKIVDKLYGVEAIGGEIKHGLVSRNGVINRGQDVIWASEFGVIRNQNHIVEDISEGNIRGDYREITDKSLIIAALEKKANAFRMYDGVDKEYLLTEKGWVTIDQYTKPDEYLSSEDGTLWFSKDGSIYKQSGYKDRRHDEVAYSNISYVAKTMPIDISLLSPKMRYNDTFYINAVWIDYEKTSDTAPITITTYLDDIEFSSEQFTDTSKAFHKLPLGASCKKFQVKVSGNNGGEFFAIHSMGVLWKPLNLGRNDGRNN